MQFIFAGKAHPQDQEGKKLIQQLVQLARDPDFRKRMVFLEDYDMEIARFMVQGGDVWLNTPRVPLEACGTSGMKAMVNGVLNVSTVDGWWAEAYEPGNQVGYAIGRGEIYEDWEYQDFVEGRTLYNVLENHVAPDFYERGHDNMPRGWIGRMRNALERLGPRFSSNRMVVDYVQEAYKQAAANTRRLSAKNYAPAKELAAWRMDMMTKWSEVRIREIEAGKGERIHVDEPLPVEAEVHLNGLRPEDVRVEIYAGTLNEDGEFRTRWTTLMSPSGKGADEGWVRFAGEVRPSESGRFGLSLRVLPNHPLLHDPHALGLIRWAEE